MRTVSVTRGVSLDERQREQLEAFARSRSLPHGLVIRAKIVLGAAEGAQNVAISKALSVSRETVSKWRERFVRQGIEGLYDEYRSGRPRSIDDERVAELVSKTLHSKPKGATQWSTRDMAEQSGISKSTVQRVWSAFGLKPHHTEGHPPRFLPQRQGTDCEDRPVRRRLQQQSQAIRVGRYRRLHPAKD